MALTTLSDILDQYIDQEPVIENSEELDSDSDIRVTVIYHQIPTQDPVLRCSQSQAPESYPDENGQRPE